MSDGGITPKSTNADMGSASGSASPAKKDAAAAPSMPKFTEKEELVLKMAWQCLKSGPPEIDIAKLMELCGFNTQKNTWGAIKKKLMTMAPPSASASGEGEDGGATPKPKATPKKRAAAKNGETDGSPAKKPRTPKKAKTPTKVKAEEDAEGEEGEE